MFSSLKHQFLLHFIVVLWGFTGILGKLIQLDAIFIVWYRVLFSFITIGIGMLFFRSSFCVYSKKEFIKIFIVGFFVALHWFFFYKSIQLSTASFGILCLSTTTLHVSWLEPLVMGRKLSLTELLTGFVVVFGVFFVSGDLGGQSLSALFYGLFSALFAAFFAVFNLKLTNKNTPYQISFYEMGSATLFITLILFFQGRLSLSVFSISIEDFFWLLFLAVVCTSFAFLAMIFVMKKLGAFTVSLSINLEPVYTIILAVFILKENTLLGSQFYLGAFVIVAVVLANSFTKNYKRKSV